MSSSRNPRFGRTALRVELLEDRTNPSPVVGTLPEQINAGLIASDRLIVTGSNVSALKATPYAQDVKSLGFGTYSVRLKAGTDLGGALAYYGSLGGVTAEADPIIHVQRLPGDPYYDAIYGPTKIGAPVAWNVTTGNPNFVVGVIDTGVDYTHPDLRANIWTNPGEIAGNGVDDDNNGYIDDIHGWDFANNDNDPMDDDSHGTHVSGTIGAVGGNGVGVAGINWNVKIMALKSLGPFGGFVSDSIAALNYSVMMGVKVTNNSYGSAAPSAARAQAIARAQSAGQIFVAAAGNDAMDNDIYPSFPANLSTTFNNVISVAATDNNDQLADFSQYGATTVTLAAPGVHILSTVPGGGYEYFDGTSMATPHVAGAIALYWGANPTLTYLQVIEKLKSSVDKLPGLAGKVSTGGRLNVAKMFGVSVVPPVVVDAPAGSEVVRVLGPGGTTQLALNPHPGFLGGIKSAAGDVNGDGVADVVTAATLGGHVKVFDGVTQAELFSFYGFEGYQGPINVALGDTNGDGLADIIIAANLNGHVKVFDGRTGQMTFSQLVYDGYLGAIAVSSADMDGDGTNELLTAADAGAGVHVKEFRAGTLSLRDSFFATGPGAWTDFSISAGIMGTDGRVLLVSQGPQVRVLDAQTKEVRADFIAFDPLAPNAQVTVKTGNLTGDPTAELVVMSEEDGQSQVKVYDSMNFALIDSFVAGSR